MFSKNKTAVGEAKSALTPLTLEFGCVFCAFCIRSRSFSRRSAAEPLAEALHMFALDLIKLVCRYLVYPTASAGSKLLSLFEITNQQSAAVLDGYCHAIAFDRDDRLWIGSGPRVNIFSAEGKFLQQFRGPVRGAFGIAFAANSDIYISDWNANCLLVCRPDGNVSRRFAPVTGRGVLNHPASLLIDDEQLVYLCDQHNNRVVVLKLDGSLVREFKAVSGAPPLLHFPTGIAMTANGEIVVADQFNDRVAVRSRLPACC